MSPLQDGRVDRHVAHGHTIRNKPTLLLLFPPSDPNEVFSTFDLPRLTINERNIKVSFKL